MNAEEQAQYVQSAYFRTLESLYRKDSLLKLAAVHARNPKWYNRSFRLMELFSAQVEAALMEANLHRAVRYVCALSVCVRDIMDRMNQDFCSVEAGLVR